MSRISSEFNNGLNMFIQFTKMWLEHAVKLTIVDIYSNLTFTFKISGNFSLWSTAALFEMGNTGINITTETDVHQLNLGMVVQNKMEIFPAFHQETRAHFLKFLPLKIITELDYVGHTSQALKTKIQNEDGKVLATEHMVFVCVNEESRRPVPFPSWFREKYAAFTKPKNQILAKEKVAKPENGFFSYKMKTAFSDTDTNLHVNQAHYVRYCVDCAETATAAGFYSGIKENFLLYGAKSLTTLYSGESRAGEELIIHTWEDASNPLLLYFQIEKEEKAICFFTIEMYPGYHSKL